MTLIIFSKTESVLFKPDKICYVTKLMVVSLKRER